MNLEPSINSLSKMIEAKGVLLISVMLLKSPLTLQLVDGGQLHLKRDFDETSERGLYSNGLLSAGVETVLNLLAFICVQVCECTCCQYPTGPGR